MTTESIQRHGIVFDVGATLDQGRWTGRQKRIVGLVASAIVLDGYDNQVLGFAVPMLLREWHITRDIIAPVFALGFVGMVLGTFLGGSLGDRIGRRPALIASVMVFALATAATALVHSVAGLALFRAIAGIGLGAAMPNATTLLAEFSPLRRRSLAVTLGIVCIPLGGVLGGLVASYIIPVMGWRALFVLGGAAPLAIALLLYVRLPESPRFLARRPQRWAELAQHLRAMGHRVEPDAAFVDTAGAEGGEAMPVRALFGRDFLRDTAALWSAFFACLLTTYVVFNWAPTLLTQSGLDISTASLAVALFNIGGVVAAICTSALMSRFGSRPVMAITSLGAVGGALVMSWLKVGGAAQGGWILAMMAVEGGLINAAQTSLYALAAQVYPTALRSTGVGAAAGFGRIGAIVSSFLGATIIAVGWSAYFQLLAFGMVVTMIAILCVGRHVAAQARPTG